MIKYFEVDKSPGIFVIKNKSNEAVTICHICNTEMVFDSLSRPVEYRWACLKCKMVSCNRCCKYMGTQGPYFSNICFRCYESSL